MNITNSDAMRFWQKVMVADGCWMWTGAHKARGYGHMWLSGHYVLVHRFSYELHYGAIPTDREIDHRCKNPGCVNPSHLEAVTHRANMLRGNTFAARQAAKTECKHGHPFDTANTYISPRGHRDCRTCRQTWDKARRPRRTH